MQSNANVLRVQDGKNKWKTISVHYEINATKRVKQKCVETGECICLYECVYMYEIRKMKNFEGTRGFKIAQVLWVNKHHLKNT